MDLLNRPMKVRVEWRCVILPSRGHGTITLMLCTHRKRHGAMDEVQHKPPNKAVLAEALHERNGRNIEYKTAARKVAAHHKSWPFLVLTYRNNAKSLAPEPNFVGLTSTGAAPVPVTKFGRLLNPKPVETPVGGIGHSISVVRIKSMRIRVCADQRHHLALWYHHAYHTKPPIQKLDFSIHIVAR